MLIINIQINQILQPELLLNYLDRRLTSCAGNWFADHNEWPNRIYTIIRQYIFLNLSEWYHWIEIINK